MHNIRFMLRDTQPAAEAKKDTVRFHRRISRKKKSGLKQPVDAYPGASSDLLAWVSVGPREERLQRSARLPRATCPALSRSRVVSRHISYHTYCGPSGMARGFPLWNPCSYLKGVAGSLDRAPTRNFVPPVSDMVLSNTRRGSQVVAQRWRLASLPRASRMDANNRCWQLVGKLRP